MINNGNMYFLGAAILKPYQRSIISELDRRIQRVQIQRPKMLIGEALEDLLSNLKNPSEDIIFKKIDLLLAKMVTDSQSLQRLLTEPEEILLTVY